MLKYKVSFCKGVNGELYAVPGIVFAEVKEGLEVSGTSTRP